MSAITKQDAGIPALAMSEQELLSVLESSLYPGASADSIKLVIGYCKASSLDPMQKPVHIVPMWDSKAGRMRDVIMPGVGSYRVMAARSGQYAGVTEPEFGPDVTENIGGVEITYPAWCKVTVKRRLPSGEIVEFSAIERWKENYAVKGGKEKSIAPNAMWAKRPYGQIAKCFDHQTEVLTTNGFERFDSVTGKILQVTDTGLLECDAIPFSQDYDGEMIAAEGTRLNFSVTPNHDMVISGGKIEAGLLYEQATQIGGKFLIPRAPAGHKNDAEVTDAVLQLLGYYLADGSHTGYHQFRISVSRLHKVDRLRALGLHRLESIKKDAGRVAVAGSREIVTQSDKTTFTYDFSLIGDFASADKSVNATAMLDLSPRQAKIVVDSILEFDGSDNGVGVRRLTQKNKNVIAAFEVAAVHAGYSVSPRKDRKSDIGSAYTVTVSEAGFFPVVRGSDRNKASLVKQKNSSGKVWCVTVPSGTIVVRRNGFSMLCGNCSEAQALRKAFPEVGAQPTSDEMEGKSLSEDNVIEGQFRKEPEKPEMPVMTADILEKHKPRILQALSAGTSTADGIIAKLATKYVVDDAMQEAIRELAMPVPETPSNAEWLAGYENGAPQ